MGFESDFIISGVREMAIIQAIRRLLSKDSVDKFVSCSSVSISQTLNYVSRLESRAKEFLSLGSDTSGTEPADQSTNLEGYFTTDDIESVPQSRESSPEREKYGPLRVSV